MSVVEIALFVCTLFTLFTFMISIVWSTLVSGISPMPSSRKARQAMLQMVNDIDCQIVTDIDSGPIFELGSGWGNLLIPLAKKYPQRKIVGYELSVMPWLTTLILKKLHGLSNITLYRKNFLFADISSATIILCYLYPAGMQKIENKIESKIKSKTEAQCDQLHYLISNNFALPLRRPIKIIQIDDIYKSPIYLYQFKW